MGDFVVMPNHVHLLAAFATEEALKEQCDSWMHYTAFRINQANGEKGKLWQEEPFDHLVRSPEQYDYLRNVCSLEANGDFPLQSNTVCRLLIDWGCPGIGRR